MANGCETFGKAIDAKALGSEWCENFEMANGHETLEHMNMEYSAAGGVPDAHGC